MPILSLQLGHNATAGLSIDSKIVGVLSQEKLDNIKNSSAFPYLAISALLKQQNLTPDSIDTVVICGQYIVPNFLSDNPYSFNIPAGKGLIRSIAKYCKARVVKSYFADVYYFLRYKYLLKTRHNVNIELHKNLARLGIFPKKVEYVDHHTCHAYSAAFFFNDSVDSRLIFTLDGEGDFCAGTIWGKKPRETENTNSDSCR